MPRSKKHADVVQVLHEGIDQLVRLAYADGSKTDFEVAKWIIAHSEVWRRRGYDEIIKAMGVPRPSNDGVIIPKRK